MTQTCAATGMFGGWTLGVALLGVLAVTPVTAAGSDTYAIESTKAARTLLLDVAHAGPRLVAVGDRGHILYSDDQGANWTQARVPTRQLLTAVYFADAQHGWAVGHDAQILASTDGGVSWNKQFEDVTREAPLLDVWFQDATTGFAIGAYGMLLETTDGGQQWHDVSERLDNPEQYHLNAIAAVKDSGLFIVGEQGSMFRSTDQGAHWEAVQGPYQGSLFGVIGTAQPSTLLTYGLRGNLYRSTDFGEQWQRIEVQGARGPMEFGLAGATLLDTGELVLVGNGGTVLRSQDDGQSFSVYSRPDRVALAAVVGGAGNGLILAGQGGVRVTAGSGAQVTP